MTTTAPASYIADLLARATQRKLTANTLQILCILADDGQLPMGEIARALDVSTASVTHLADGLEKSGLIARLPGKSDRRIIWLKLTDHGRDTLAEILL